MEGTMSKETLEAIHKERANGNIVHEDFRGDRMSAQGANLQPIGSL